MVKCLIVDDDHKILNYVSQHLEQEGFETIMHDSGKTALDDLEHSSVDIAIVDIMMEGMDGFELCHLLKEGYQLPVIMLTARDALTDKERAFISGTDDYLTKPFEIKELIYRIKAVLRRYQINAVNEVTIGNLILNQSYLELKVGTKTMNLPNKEFQLMFLFANYPRQVLLRDKIIEKIWGFDYQGDERTLDVHIKRLRQRLKKLNANVSIKTVRNQGYKVEADV